jgi:hypothetical protein
VEKINVHEKKDAFEELKLLGESENKDQTCRG